MGPQGIIAGGEVLIVDGKIARVGAGLSAPEGCQTVDAGGGFIMPGHIGIFETGIGDAGVDGNEEHDPVTPQMRGLDGIYPLDPEFERACKAGVTCVATGPGSANPIGGQFLAMKTWGRTMEEMVVLEPLAMKMAFGENPKNVYGRSQTPATRMGVAALIREALYKAREYAGKKERAQGDPDRLPPFDMKLEALIPVVKGELLVKAHAHRADDIMTAIRIAEEFGLKMTIEHASEGHLIAGELARKNRIVILGQAGVKLAIMTDLPGMHEENLVVCAGICHRRGLSEEGALRAITLHAAEALGLSGRLGSLEEGKDGDVAVFNKNPVKHLDAACICTVMDGAAVHREI